MSGQRRGPVAEKLRSKEEAKRELCQTRDEAEALSKVEVDTLRSSVDSITSMTQQISRWTPQSTLFLSTSLSNPFFVFLSTSITYSSLFSSLVLSLSLTM